LALLFFTLALLSKPMAVTLPFVLLLLDFWPLRRLRSAECGVRSGGQENTQSPASGIQHPVFNLYRLLLEKWPFFLLSLVDCYITSQVQQPAMAELNVLPVSTRVLNMILSYGRYLVKLFWPAKLAIAYPYNPSLPVAQVAVVLALFVALSFFAWRFRHRLPWFVVGWLWFLGTLVPVIGLVQVGQQACADRYTYLPSIGILVLAVWTVAFLAGAGAPACSRLEPAPLVRPDELEIVGDKPAGSRRSGRWALRSLGLLSVAALLALSIATRAQLAWWQSSEKLMRHSISVAGPSVLARGGLASELLKKGMLEEAATQYRLGSELDGDVFPALVGLGTVYAAQGKDAEAERLLRRALALRPNAAVHFQLADFLQQQGRLDEARIHYLQGLALAPYHAGARNNLGNLYARQNDWPAAREQFERALKLNPKAAGVHQNLGNLLAIQSQMPAAQAEFEAALRYQTNYAKAHFGLAGVFAAQKQDTNVVCQLREAVRLDPEWLAPLNNLAWLLATHKDPRLRDGPEAVRLANRAIEVAKTNNWERLDTLAAAQAEAGQFHEAVAAARQALALAVQAELTNEANAVSNRLDLYQRQLPYREP
jgi:tetratricopeptide (TPR) repeat protein